jgi:hypothetical protein
MPHDQGYKPVHAPRISGAASASGLKMYPVVSLLTPASFHVFPDHDLGLELWYGTTVIPYPIYKPC